MKQFLLITGISGSGKSEYCSYLQRKYGFFHHEEDAQGRNFRTKQGQVIEPNNPNFVTLYLEKYDSVTMEWGFIPGLFLATVLGLKNQGAKLFWFRCPDERALENYSKKWNWNNARIQDWHAQINRIRKANLPTKDFQIVETMRDGRFRPHEELDNEVLV